MLTDDKMHEFAYEYSILQIDNAVHYSMRRGAAIISDRAVKRGGKADAGVTVKRGMARRAFRRTLLR